jgi:hypothetical protein
VSIIDSFFVALGFKTDTAGLDAFEKRAYSVKDSILSMGNIITAAVAGFAAKGIAEIGSTFEQNKIQIAGFLSALGLSSDFNAGLRDAQGIIQQITIDAAKLPGEAEDYIQVFKANAAYLKNGLPGANVNQIADFTNKLTAVAKTVASNLDAAQIARESAQLLAVQGRAGGHNVLWQRLIPFLMQVKGQANITAQSFNAMTQPKRVELLQAAFAKLQPMLDASASSFDAMWGAAVSAFKQITRLTTAPLFEGMKKALDRINGAFYDSNGQLTALGQKVVDAGKRISYLITRLVTVAAEAAHDFALVVGWVGKFRVATIASKVALAALASVVAGIMAQKVLGRLLGIAGALMKLRFAVIANTALIGALAVAIFLIAEDLWGFFHGAQSVTGLLVDKWGPALYVVIGALALLSAAFLAVAVASKAAAIKTALSWTLSLAPFLLIIAAIATAIKMFDDLRTHSGFFNDQMRKIGNSLSGTIGSVAHMFGVEGEGPKFGGGAATDMRGGGVLASPPSTAAEAQAPAAWTGLPAFGGSGSVTNYNSHVDKVEIKTDDPEKMAKEYHRRVIRNHQSKVGF